MSHLAATLRCNDQGASVVRWPGANSPPQQLLQLFCPAPVHTTDAPLLNQDRYAASAMTSPGSAFAASSAALLGDTPLRDYSRKLSSFNSFAEPELRALIANVGLGPGMRILDAGCGTGEALPWLLDEVKPSGSVVGIDLAAAHVDAAGVYASTSIEVIQGDLLTAQLAPASVDFVWCVNTINHFRDPIQGVIKLTTLLRPHGRI